MHLPGSRCRVQPGSAIAVRPVRRIIWASFGSPSRPGTCCLEPASPGVLCPGSLCPPGPCEGLGGCLLEAGPAVCSQLPLGLGSPGPDFLAQFRFKDVSDNSAWQFQSRKGPKLNGTGTSRRASAPGLAGEGTRPGEAQTQPSVPEADPELSPASPGARPLPTW